MFDIIFNTLTVRGGVRPKLRDRISQKILFEMPPLKADTAVILGATRATGLLAEAAFKAGHKHFVVVGGAFLKREPSVFTPLLEKGLNAKELPAPRRDMRENEYGREVLQSLGVDDSKITIYYSDHSKNLGQNMAILKSRDFDERPAVEFYGLAGTARRTIATARKVWGDNGKTAIAAHNVYPPGVNRDNWHSSLACTFFAVSEAHKILPFNREQSRYEALGYCAPVDMATEQARARTYIGNSQLSSRARAGREVGGP